MLINNTEHLNQNGCHINIAMFLEIPVFRQGTLVHPLTKGGFYIVYFPKVQYVCWTLQQCNLFVKSSVGRSVWYTTFPGIYSANYCNTRRIVVKGKMAV
jgi:hypothetical protein